MPKRNNGSTVTVSGNNYTTIALVSGLANIPINPGYVSARLGEIAAAFEFFKFSRFRYRILPNSTTSVGGLRDVAVGYFPEETNANPTKAQIDEFTPCAHFAISSTGSSTPIAQTVPSAWKSVSKKILSGVPLSRYLCNASSTEDVSENQGTLWFGSTWTGDTGLIVIETEYTCTFSGINVGGL
jgi:hypothetical protein